MNFKKMFFAGALAASAIAACSLGLAGCDSEPADVGAAKAALLAYCQAQGDLDLDKMKAYAVPGEAESIDQLQALKQFAAKLPKSKMSYEILDLQLGGEKGETAVGTVKMTNESDGGKSVTVKKELVKLPDGWKVKFAAF